jgi:hypothetical protein
MSQVSATLVRIGFGEFGFCFCNPKKVFYRNSGIDTLAQKLSVIRELAA